MNDHFVKVLAAAGVVAATLVPVSQIGAASAAGAAQASAHRALPQCDSSDLRATYKNTDAGAGHRFGVLRLTNVSDHTCTTGGYGGLSYVGHGDGTQIGAAAERTKGTVQTIVLRPGERAHSAVSETVAQNYPRRACKPTHVDGFRVYVPNETRSQYVKHPTTGCARSSVHLISHRPFRKG